MNKNIELTAGQEKLYRLFIMIQADKGEVLESELHEAARACKMGGQYIRKLADLCRLGVLEIVREHLDAHTDKVTVVEVF